MTLTQHLPIHRQMACMLAVLCVLGVATLPSLAAKDVPTAELTEAVEYLMRQTRDSKATFIRNGKSYTADQAVEHMTKKYEHFLKKGQVETPEDFIRLAATQSLISGKAYTLKLRDGSELNSADWLTGKLKQFRAQEAGH